MELGVEDVLDRFLAEVMIDAIDLGFAKDRQQDGVESSGRFEIVAERFFHHDS